MNRMLQLLIFIFWGTLLYSQNVVIDGVTFSADKKTLIRYPENKTDNEYVVPEGTEIIGEEAFLSTAYLHEITLPTSLKEIRGRAFAGSSATCIVWSNFPAIIGEDIFAYSHIKEFKLSNENLDYSLIDGVLFSKDKKILLKYPPRKDYFYENYSIPEGTEFIQERAFDYACLDYVELPSTLKEIGDYAFWISPNIPTRSREELDYRYLLGLTCNASIPPLLVGNPFAYTRAISLKVPDKSFDLYYNTVGWKEFWTINGVEPPSFLKPVLSSNTLQISLTDGYLNLTSEKELSRVMIYNLNGLEIADCTLNGNYYSEEITNQFPKLFVLKVIYAYGTEDIFKLYK
ncbi:leucine-rich repeat domain-containing protein [Bacteroides sp.]